MAGQTTVEKSGRTEGKEVLDLGRRIIVFIGPEGSGKSTQAKLLAAASGKPFFSTGDTLRFLAEHDTGPLGDECREMFALHTYLSPDTLLKILLDYFGQESFCDGWSMDGGLRTLKETVEFQAMLETVGRILPITVVYLQISREESFNRLIGSDRNRKDDTQEGIASRLEKFHNELDERLEVIRSQPGWNLIEVDATPDEETVYKTVCGLLRLS